MRCVTWSRDSHGLFDYESRYISKKNIKTTREGRIIRLNNDVEFVQMDLLPEHVDPTAKPLIKIEQGENGRFRILNDTRGDASNVDSNENPNNMMFVVVRNLKS